MSTGPLAGTTQGNGLATSTTCAGCGAPLVPDQRYCLACGRPASPVRLAFLDVLQGERAPLGAGGTPAPPGAQVYAAAYPAGPEPDGLLGALRRYSGLLALLGVLLGALLIGLLVGHWATGGSSASAAKQVVEVKLPNGVAAAPLAGSSAPTSSSGSSPSSSSGTKAGASSSSHAAKSEKAESASEEAQAAKEAKTATAPPPVKKKASSSTLQKLSSSTGKQHEREVSKLIKGDEPIETH